MKLVVAKFGGSSLSDVQCMRGSARIAANLSGLGIMVVSATGKTTNLLTKLAKMASKGEREETRELLESLTVRHLEFARELGIDKSEIEDILSDLRSLILNFSENGHYSLSELDRLLSCGEQLSSRLMVRALEDAREGGRVEFLDVRTVLKTDDHFGRALPLLDEIAGCCTKILRDRLKEGVTFVTQGFVGSTLKAETTTLGRGGSDYSAALLAEGVGASELQIWTDVSGVATTDPLICSTAKTIKELSFVEAAELATFGAKVLHPTTMWPAMRKNIPIYVGNSLAKEDGGTWIRKEVDDHPMVRAIALRERQSILTLSTPRMVSTYGFLHDIFLVFKKHKVSVDLVTTSEISVAITMSDVIVDKQDLVKDLGSLGQLKVENGYSLIGVIGNKITHTPRLGQDILESISSINIRLLCSGASEHNFCFLVESKCAREIVTVLHQKFL